jgi:cytochrome c oxidase subunit 2
VIRSRGVTALRRAVAAAVLGAVVGGCMPDPVTDQARAVRDLWSQFLIASILVGGTVWVLITFAVLRYRRPRRADQLADDMPRQTHGSTRLEVAWTAIPIAIILVLFALTMGALGRIDARSPGATTVEVTAFRWQWRFDYAGTGVTVVGGPDTPAEMVVPAGEPIHIVLTSIDVAHAFYVPQFLFKRDAIPGYPNQFDITIDEPGSYRGQCAEFCGVFHARMLLSVRAVTRPEYEAWLATAPRPSLPPITAPSGSPETRG